jgi:hypothetical protein
MNGGETDREAPRGEAAWQGGAAVLVSRPGRRVRVDIAEEREPAVMPERGADPENMVDMLVATQTVHLALSQMADQKASILMGTTFVIFTLAVGQVKYDSLSFLPLVVLGAFSVVAAVCAALSILPAIGRRKHNPNRPAPSVNLLFFGSFVRFKEEEYIRQILELACSDEAIYRTIARDIYQNGVVLAKKKYHWLGHAYRVFIAGLVASVATFVVQIIYHMVHTGGL